MEIKLTRSEKSGKWEYEYTNKGKSDKGAWYNSLSEVLSELTKSHPEINIPADKWNKR